MLSIGWTEMMLVAAVALIVVGPKDLPGMLRQIGKAVGSVRRMGNDFKRELNKVTAVDELKDIKNSIAAPLTDVRKNIENEFNSIAPGGEVIPSGKISPKDPDAQSVVEEIKSAAGMEEKTNSAKTTKATKPARKVRGVVSRSTKSKTNSEKEAASKAEPVKSVTAKKASAKKPTTRKPTAKKPTAKKPAAKIPATKKPATNKPATNGAK